MTQQQIVQEFKDFPKAKQFEVICELAKLYEEDLTKHLRNGYNISTEEEKIINRLREIGAII
ncbi:hypothetical protein BH20ACI1_BH20ACI1_28810 [soil metagenome]